jgi:hypothetical protein
MRGDTHVRFGGRARETDPGQPGHRARARPNRSDTAAIMPDRRSPLVSSMGHVLEPHRARSSSPRPLVGLPDHKGRLRIAGRTTAVPPALRHELPELLVAAGGAHPWPEVIPSSRFGQRPSKPVEYTRVEPSLVVELDVDVAFEQYRWRHAARLVRLRRDLAAGDLEWR